jgi:hypothetical protein
MEAYHAMWGDLLLDPESRKQHCDEFKKDIEAM